MKKIANIKTDFSQWYQDVIFEAELVDSSPTRGSMVFRPYGYEIWENIQTELNKRIKELGCQNAYFPLLIPESFLKKEAEHVEGFAPEVAVVTHAGGKKLEEPMVIRPTSETIVYHMFARWIKSWRDLPLKINQWANVVRWELRTRAFLRTTEILWHEGHTAHATYEEAEEMALAELKMYKEFFEEFLAIPAIEGVKSATERFAGADDTYCIEALMQDGKALQLGTTHLLKESFPASFDVSYQDADGKLQTPRCTSFGTTPRMIGAMIMTHGDERGLVMPPKIAPIQVVIVPIYRNDEDKEKVFSVVRESIIPKLKEANVRIHLDCDETKSPGAKFYHWEVRGVPIRLEIGPRDIDNNTAVLVNRIESDRTKKKEFVSIDGVELSVQKLLDTIQKRLFDQAGERLKTQWYKEEKLEKIGPALDEKPGLYQTGWCGRAECEEKLKEHKACIATCLINQKEKPTCFACEKESTGDVLVAKSY
jgi:prolyl-tRNA synthetase